MRAFVFNFALAVAVLNSVSITHTADHEQHQDKEQPAPTITTSYKTIRGIALIALSGYTYTQLDTLGSLCGWQQGAARIIEKVVTSLIISGGFLMSSDYIFPKILDRYAPNTDHNQRENILAYGLPIFAGLSQIGVLAVITNTYGNNIRVVGCTEPDYNCVICWDDENEHTHQLPNCIHTACGDCYSRLMQDYNTCPICRTPF